MFVNVKRFWMGYYWSIFSLSSVLILVPRKKWTCDAHWFHGRFLFDVISISLINSRVLWEILLIHFLIGISVALLCKWGRPVSRGTEIVYCFHWNFFYFDRPVSRGTEIVYSFHWIFFYFQWQNSVSNIKRW